MDSFIDKLRMNNIFNPSNPNPLGSPDLSAGQLNPQMVMGLLNQMKGLNHNPSDDIHSGGGQLQNIADQYKSPMPVPQQQQDVIFKPPPSEQITGYQRGLLDLRNDQLDSKERQFNSTMGFKGKVESDKVNIANQKNDVAKHRADVYDFKAKHPGMKLAMPKGGNITAFDPITGKTMDLGIPTGSMDEKDKLELLSEQSLTKQSEGANQKLELQGLKGEDNLKAIGTRVQGSKDIADMKFGGNTKPELPTQTKVRQVNKARELVNSRPDLAPYIQFDSSGNFTVSPPSAPGFFGGGVPQDKHDEINNLIYGSSSDSSESNDNNTQHPLKSDVKKPVTKSVSKYKVTVE